MPKKTAPDHSPESQAAEPERWMDVDALSAYTTFTVQSIYRRVSEKTIPHVRVGRRVLFDKRKIDRWLEKQAVRTDRK